MSVRANRVAIGVAFAVHGAVGGTFATRIPAIAEHLHLTPGSLGLALFMPGLGSMAVMPTTGRLIHRIGGKAATRLLLAIWCVALILPAIAPNLLTLCLVLLVFGACAGTADVAMNTEGVALEQRIGKSIISGLHGLWSVGGFAAAGVGALAAHENIGVLAHFATMTVVLLVIGGLACARLAPTPRRSAIGGAFDEPKPARFALPRGAVLIIALVAFCAIFPESAGQDWAAVYLRRVLGAGHATAALGYTVFVAGMAICRLTGDRVIRRLGAVPTIRIGAVAGTIGAGLIVWAVNAALTIVGFGLIGVGIAVVVPLAFAAAGRIGSGPSSAQISSAQISSAQISSAQISSAQTGSEATGGESTGSESTASAQTGNAIAGVATIAYGAGLAAPGAIGAIASLTSLRVSFVLVAVLVAIVAASAGALRIRPTMTDAIVSVNSDAAIPTGAIT